MAKDALHQVLRQVDEVPLRDETYDLLLLDDGETTNVMVAHQGDGLEGRSLRSHRDIASIHYLMDSSRLTSIHLEIVA